MARQEISVAPLKNLTPGRDSNLDNAAILKVLLYFYKVWFDTMKSEVIFLKCLGPCTFCLKKNFPSEDPVLTFLSPGRIVGTFVNGACERFKLKGRVTWFPPSKQSSRVETRLECVAASI